MMQYPYEGNSFGWTACKLNRRLKMLHSNSLNQCHIHTSTIKCMSCLLSCTNAFLWKFRPNRCFYLDCTGRLLMYSMAVFHSKVTSKLEKCWRNFSFSNLKKSLFWFQIFFHFVLNSTFVFIWWDRYDWKMTYFRINN
jgi:hypothetical protein